jgi:heme/copper-type cytochrome/quinol oxidase subunit 2
LYHCTQTLLFLLNLLIGYALMLMVMTYNAWVFIAVVAGAVLGRLICFVVIGRHTSHSNEAPKQEQKEVEMETWTKNAPDNNNDIDSAQRVQLIASV